MKPRILFVAQCWHGRGGIQSYSRDLWEMLKNDEEIIAKRCTPWTRGIKAQVEVIIKGIFRVIFRRYDAIICTSADLAPLAWFASKKPGTRGCLSAMGLDLMLRRKWYQWMLRHTLPGIDVIHCISHATAEVAKSKGAKDDQISIIPLGTFTPESIDRSRVNFEEPLILSVGRLMKRKGHAWFVREVLPLIFEKRPNVRYRHIGRGKDIDAVRAAIDSLKFKDRIELITDADDDLRNKSYEEASVFVMPNIPVAGDMEGQGIVCIEASIRGIPVCASRLEGVKDAIVEEKTGRFYQPENAAECASVILEMLENLMDSGGVRTETVKNFAWNSIYARYRQELLNV